MTTSSSAQLEAGLAHERASSSPRGKLEKNVGAPSQSPVPRLLVADPEARSGTTPPGRSHEWTRANSGASSSRGTWLKDVERRRRRRTTPARSSIDREVAVHERRAAARARARVRSCRSREVDAGQLEARGELACLARAAAAAELDDACAFGTQPVGERLRATRGADRPSICATHASHVSMHRVVARADELRTRSVASTRPPRRAAVAAASARSSASRFVSAGRDHVAAPVAVEPHRAGSSRRPADRRPPARRRGTRAPCRAARCASPSRSAAGPAPR